MHACILAFAFSFKYSLLPEIHVFIQAQLNFFPDGLYIAFVFFVCFSTKYAPVAGEEAHNMHHERAGGKGRVGGQRTRMYDRPRRIYRTVS